MVSLSSKHRASIRPRTRGRRFPVTVVFLLLGFGVCAYFVWTVFLMSSGVDDLSWTWQKLVSGNSPWPFRTAMQVRIYFIHIGRGGAKTIKRAIHDADRVAHQLLDCRMNATDRIETDPCRPFQPNEPHLPQRIYGYFHIHNPSYVEREREWLRNHTNLLLVTARNPVDRLVSAFRYVSAWNHIIWYCI